MANCSRTRRRFLKQTGLGVMSMTMPQLFFSCGKPQQRPNIIFIMTDDHAAHALSCYGSKINQTPNLDRIAEEGMRFDNCFCTNSICAPSRASILTGKYSHLNGIKDNREEFDGSQQTFPKLFQEAGYEAAIIGKWHLKTEPTGFDYYKVLPGQGKYFDPEFREIGSWPKTQQQEGYVTDVITDECIRWIKNRSAETPFLLMYHHKAPHRYWEPDEKHWEMFKDREIPEPDTLFDDYSTRTEAVKNAQMTLAHHMHPADTGGPPPNGLNGKELVRWRYQQYMRRYLACVASVDDNVGRLLDYLKTSGLERNTVVVYTSDQGFFLGDHGWFDKRFMYEESLRMPLLIKYPKEIESNSVNKDIVLNIDFAPTFLSLAEAKIPEGIQGRSFHSQLKGKTPQDWREAMYYHYYEYPGWHMVDRHYGIRTHRYKLIHYYGYTDAWEFYDLKKDPQEVNNVYGKPEYSDEIQQLKKKLYQLQQYYKDTKPEAGQIEKSTEEKY